MLSKVTLTEQQKIRFICSNHMLYDTPEKLKTIMSGLDINPDRFDVSNESWYESVGWWKDEAFLGALTNVNVELDKDIIVAVNRTDSQKYFVSSKK